MTTAIDKTSNKEVLWDIRINLVKAAELGLGLREALAFGVIQRMITLEAAGRVHINGERWWLIDAQVLRLRDAGKHLASCDANERPTDSYERLISNLHNKKLVEYQQIRPVGGSKVLNVMRLKTNVVLWSDAE